MKKLMVYICGVIILLSAGLVLAMTCGTFYVMNQSNENLQATATLKSGTFLYFQKNVLKNKTGKYEISFSHGKLKFDGKCTFDFSCTGSGSGSKDRSLQFSNFSGACKASDSTIVIKN